MLLLCCEESIRDDGHFSPQRWIRKAVRTRKFAGVAVLDVVRVRSVPELVNLACLRFAAEACNKKQKNAC